MKKAKQLYEEALQIPENEGKQKAKERYTNLNADFQRTARSNKKEFSNEQCKEIEGKNRMGKTRVLFIPAGSVVKNPPAMQETCRRHEFSPWVGKIPWRRKWQPTLVFLPGESQGRGAWWAAVYGIAQSRTRLKRLSSSSSSSSLIMFNYSIKRHFTLFQY